MGMKRLLFFLALGLYCLPAAGQGMYGFEGGVGLGTAYKPYLTPVLEGYWLQRITHRIYAGGALKLEKYSFLYEPAAHPATATYGDLINIRQKSAYLFFSPKIDYGIGYRKYIHLHASAGPGLYMSGQQTSYEHQPFWTTAAGNVGADTIGANTTYNLPNAIFRYTLGITERIPTSGYWNIVLTQELSMVSGSLSKGGVPLNTGFISFTIGVMHKYPQVLVEY